MSKGERQNQVKKVKVKIPAKGLLYSYLNSTINDMATLTRNSYCSRVYFYCVASHVVRVTRNTHTVNSKVNVDPNSKLG